MKRIYLYHVLLTFSLASSHFAIAGEFIGSEPYLPTIHCFKDAEFQKSKLAREQFESEHKIHGIKVRAFNDSNLDSEAKQILVLPFHFMHLRQTLQFLFLLAGEEQITQIRSIEDKLDWVLRIAQELALLHPQAFDQNTGSHHSLTLAATQGRDTFENEIAFSLQHKCLKDREQIIDSVFYSYCQYYLLKFIREFEPNDRLGYDPDRQSLGILDDGDYELIRLAWVNQDLSENERLNTPDRGRRNFQNAYVPGLDLYSRMSIDFTRIDSKIAIPITPDMNGWQRDWPDSAGIRFFIKGRSYDVYFPVKWSNFHTDLAPEHLNLDKDARSFWAFGASDLQNTYLTPDGIRYFKPLGNTAKDKARNTRNFGHYPLQTPKIIKAFSKRPLHRIWNTPFSFGIGGSLPARIISDHKDEAYETLEEAIAKFDCMPRFEFLWDARSSFFPEHHVSDLRYYLEEDQTREPVWIRADHSFSPHVPIEEIASPAGFLRVLEKVDAIDQAFSWNEFVATPSELVGSSETPERIQNENRYSKKQLCGIGIGIGIIGVLGGFLFSEQLKPRRLFEHSEDFPKMNPPHAGRPKMCPSYAERPNIPDSNDKLHKLGNSIDGTVKLNEAVDEVENLSPHNEDSTKLPKPKN